MTEAGPGELTEHLFRHAAGRLVAALTRVVGPARLDLAEEVVQDALVRALEIWPYRGVPANPAGWLFAVARHLALDRLRRESILHRKLSLLDAPDGSSARAEREDDELVLIFLCCHPSLPPAARIALTLKTVGGFGVEEIAAALLARPAAVAQQLVRAKRRIRQERLPLELPEPAALDARLDSVLEVLYLMFTEGYSAHRGEQLTRAELCGEAIRLTRMLAGAEPIARPALRALLALMLLQSSRLPARTSPDSDLLRLDEQDRSLWDRDAIQEGIVHLERSAAGDRVTPYHTEAAIAACHAATVDGAVTDWARVLQLYDELLAAKPTPVVALNRAIAVAMVDGPHAGIRAVEAIHGSGVMARYHLRPAILAGLWQDAGDATRAARYYREARRLAGSEPERRFLSRRIAELESTRT
jgi:RNA polymerase sigma-70 factor (ECF subfamily)